MKQILFIALLVTACSVQSGQKDETVIDTSNGRTIVKEFISSSGAYCIAAIVPGHSVSLQCDFNHIKPAPSTQG